MSLIQQEPKKIYIYKEPYTDYSAMRWPCDSGFHIPTITERQNVFNCWTSLGAWSASNWNWAKTYLRLPFAWQRLYSNWNTNQVWTQWFYWTNSPYTSEYPTYTRIAFVVATSFSLDNAYVRAYWNSIRPFYDEAVNPISSRNTLKSWWQWLYNQVSWRWIAHNWTLHLISLSSDGTTRYTISDRNLWATTLYDWTSTPTEANAWKYYQRWNNYWFWWPDKSTPTTSTTQVNASTYWPWNYYSSSTFIRWNADRSSVQNDNLWGWVTWPISWWWDILFSKILMRKNWEDVQIWPPVYSVEPDRPDIDEFTLTGSKSLSLSNVHALAVSNDAKHLYICITWEWPIYQYEMSDGTISTLGTSYSYTKSWVKSRWLFVREDWTMMFSNVDWSPYAYRWVMSTAYRVDTISSWSTHSLPSNTKPMWCEFSPDGVYYYCWYWDNGNAPIYQYTCSTAWNLNTATLTRSVNFSWTFARNSYDIRFSPTGLKMYVWQRPYWWWAGRIYQFNLSTAWNISTATYSWKSLAFPAWNQWSTFDFGNNWKRIFIHPVAASGSIYQYDAS